MANLALAGEVVVITVELAVHLLVEVRLVRALASRAATDPLVFREMPVADAVAKIAVQVFAVVIAPCRDPLR